MFVKMSERKKPPKAWKNCAAKIDITEIRLEASNLIEIFPVEV